MGLTLYAAAKQSRNPLTVGLFREIVTENELFALLPFVPKDGESFTYTREKSLPAAAWVADDGSSVAESSFEPELVTVPKRRIAADVDVDNFAQDNMSGDVDQTTVQIRKKFKSAGRTLQKAAINGAFATSATYSPAVTAIDATVVGPGQDSTRHGPGSIKYTHVGTLWQYRAPGDRTYGAAVAIAADGSAILKSDNPSKWIKITVDVSDATADFESLVRFASTTNEPDGLYKLITPAMTRTPVGADGDDLSLAIMDELLDAVKVRSNLAFAMNGKLLNRYKAILRSLGGASPEYVELPSFNPDGSPIMRRALSYDGVPIVKVDDMGSDETVGNTTTASSVVLVSLTPDEGFFAGAFGGSSFDVEADPMGRIVLGFRLREIGQRESKDAAGYRVNWYGGFGLGSTLAAARATGLKTAAV